MILVYNFTPLREPLHAMLEITPDKFYPFK